MDVKFSSRSWHRVLYDATYNLSEVKEPTNLCPYFWKVVFALAALPLSWFGYIAQRLAGERLGFWAKSVVGIFFYGVNIIFMVVGVGILSEEHAFWAIWLSGVGATLALTVTLFIIAGVGPEISDYLKNEDKQGLFFSKTRATLMKVCPKINWK